MKKTKLLVVTRHTPLPADDGAGAYLFSILEYLSGEGLEIHVVWTEPHSTIRWAGAWKCPAEYDNVAKLHLPGAIELLNWRCFPSIYIDPFLARAKHRIKQTLQVLGLWNKVSLHRKHTEPEQTHKKRTWMSPLTRTELEDVRLYCRKAKPDIILANYGWLTDAFECWPSAKRFCLHHDVAWRRAEMLSAPLGENPEIDKKQEAEFLSKAGIILSISRQDSEELKEMLPGKRVLCCPKSAKVITAQQEPEKDQLLFVGSHNAMNVEGLRWFIKEVWPIALSQRPSLHLNLCGSICQKADPSWPQVRLHGQVSDLSPFYRTASVVIIPLLRGTGLNIKLVEAAAHGKAVVACECVLAGGPMFRSAIRVGRSGAEFASLLTQVAEDKVVRTALERASAAVARTHLSATACYGEIFHEMLRPKHSLISRPPTESAPNEASSNTQGFGKKVKRSS